MTSYGSSSNGLNDDDESNSSSSRSMDDSVTGLAAVSMLKKRFRSDVESPIPPGVQTPTLISSCPHKRPKVDYAITAATGLPAPPLMSNNSDLLSMVPEEVLRHVFSYLGTLQDRFALQCTSRLFHRISDSDEILASMDLGGNIHTGEGGIFRDDDTIDSAITKITLFARAGNLEALYMLGMIKTYCQPDVEGGILILKRAATEGNVRAHYTLGLILRDAHTDEATQHMIHAASAQYLPALQEILNNRDMKVRFGELSAVQLRHYLDPICLNRLLGRYYLNSSVLREMNTSHCWNPICGRWAFKAQMMTQSSNMDLRVSRMKMCSRCCRAKYCSKLCQVYDWRSGRHKTECQYL